LADFKIVAENWDESMRKLKWYTSTAPHKPSIHLYLGVTEMIENLKAEDIMVYIILLKGDRKSRGINWKLSDWMSMM